MENENGKGAEAAAEESTGNKTRAEERVEENVRSPIVTNIREGGRSHRRLLSGRGLGGTGHSPYYSPTRASAMSPNGNADGDGERAKESDGAELETSVKRDIDVIARYRIPPNRSQGSFSHANCSKLSPSHSRLSSCEHISWDSQAWRDALPDNAFLHEQSRDLLRLRHLSMDSYHGSPTQMCQRHVRSLATWDKFEMEGSPDRLVTRSCSPMGPVTCRFPTSTLDTLPEPLYETVPLGHQHCFSLSSHKDAACMKTEATTVIDRAVEQPPKETIMTHVLVGFKNLYGVYYVPEAQRGAIAIGDLVSVESRPGENTGKVMHDLTATFADTSKLPAAMANYPRHVLYPDDPSVPLEAVNSKTSEEVLQRLPRVLRRGMNKGKKKLYYARRRESEVIDVGNRLIRDRGFNLAITSVEYQVDFRRITVFCRGERSHADEVELHAFSQQLASNVRGAAVDLIFASESPECLDVTRSITKAAFKDVHFEAAAKMKEAENARSQAQDVRTPANNATIAAIPQAAGCPTHIYPDAAMSAMGQAPLMQFYTVPPAFTPPVGPVVPPMMTTVGVGGLYGVGGVPQIRWGIPTPPPYIPPSLPGSAPGRM